MTRDFSVVTPLPYDIPVLALRMVSETWPSCGSHGQRDETLTERRCNMVKSICAPSGATTPPNELQGP